MQNPFSKEEVPQNPALLPQNAAAAAPTSTNYSLSARAVGPVIEFSLTNNGTIPLNPKPEQFALIPHGTRRVVPSDDQTAAIDVPAVVGPGQTVNGRAMFHEFSRPGNSRLVFKPDNTGTFAIVTP